MKFLEFQQTCHLLGRVLVCSDLYQLPPVKGAPIYSSTDNIKEYLSLELWNNFKVVDLTEVIRERGDLEFISSLSWNC